MPGVAVAPTVALTVGVAVEQPPDLPIADADAGAAGNGFEPLRLASCARKVAFSTLVLAIADSAALHSISNSCSPSGIAQ